MQYFQLIKGIHISTQTLIFLYQDVVKSSLIAKIYVFMTPPLTILFFRRIRPRHIMGYSLISLQLKLYFRHSCTFCTPHFFYINSNKPTAGRTKAIHRRLELSFNLYLLLLFVGQNRASKSHLHITLRISRFLQFFNK